MYGIECVGERDVRSGKRDFIAEIYYFISPDSVPVQSFLSTTTMAEFKSARGRSVWFITGCSSGFGKIFVSAILAQGDRVIATARNINSLSDFAHSDNVKLLELDITDSQHALNEKVSKAIAMFGQIDVLVNNAGYVVSGVLEELRCEIPL